MLICSLDFEAATLEPRKQGPFSVFDFAAVIWDTEEDINFIFRASHISESPIGDPSAIKFNEPLLQRMREAPLGKYHLMHSALGLTEYVRNAMAYIAALKAPCFLLGKNSQYDLDILECHFGVDTSKLFHHRRLDIGNLTLGQYLVCKRPGLDIIEDWNTARMNAWAEISLLLEELPPAHSALNDALNNLAILKALVC